MQIVLVIGAVAGAVAYLGFRGWQTWSGKRQKGCEKCGMNASTDKP
jgi:hypothetical protein